MTSEQIGNIFNIKMSMLKKKSMKLICWNTTQNSGKINAEILEQNLSGFSFNALIMAENKL